MLCLKAANAFMPFSFMSVFAVMLYIISMYTVMFIYGQ